jgi:hypothetical protein
MRDRRMVVVLELRAGVGLFHHSPASNRYASLLETPPSNINHLAAGYVVELLLSDAKVLFDSIYANRADLHVQDTK